MKHALLILLVAVIARSTGAQNKVTDEFIRKWDHSATYTHAVVEAMPAERLDYRPVPQWPGPATDTASTFRQQAVHLVQNMIWLSGTYLGHEKFGVAVDPDINYSKQQLLELIDGAYVFARLAVEHLDATALSEKVDFFAGPMTRQQILNLMDDHVTHHRAQMIIYLRLNGIKPPEYTGW